MSLLVRFATSLAMFGYPMYASYKVLSASSRTGTTVAEYRWMPPPRGSRRRGSGAVPSGEPRTELAELETWVMYWSVVAAIVLLEFWLGWAWMWIPAYAHVKLLFVLWLILPQTQGASLIYAHYLSPFLATHERDIERTLDQVKTRSLALLSPLARAALDALRAQVRRLTAASLQEPVDVPPWSSPASQHNPAEGVIAQTGSMLQHSTPVLAAAGSTVLQWATRAEQQGERRSTPRRSRHRAR